MSMVMLGLALTAGALEGAAKPPFSWDTLPVFFHSQNGTGEWSPAALAQIGRYPLATFEKAMGGAGGGSEANGPQACRAVRAQGTNTWTFYYLNSVIDWPQYHSLHQMLEAHPEYRMKDAAGEDINVLPRSKLWGFNLSIEAVASAVVADCVKAVKDGCTGGCFLDRSNNMSQMSSTQHMGRAQSAAFAAAHMAALTSLNTELAAQGAVAINNNEAALGNQAAMMIEDWAGSERCIKRLQEAVRRGLIVEAHAGDQPDSADGTCGYKNCCVDGDTNALAAFLIAGGEYSYYACAPTWQSTSSWPAASDFWLDWRAVNDYPLGAPKGEAVQDPASTVYTRSFSSGTHVAFDPRSGNGTIWWSNGVTHSGITPPATVASKGCLWQTM
eukprot:Hpha_TRINITY_DN24350_c0_g1::TRINITY_DN24350_c0_g1_i1::g.147980::m.147980